MDCHPASLKAVVSQRIRKTIPARPRHPLGKIRATFDRLRHGPNGASELTKQMEKPHRYKTQSGGLNEERHNQDEIKSYDKPDF